jgi:hypothetical protein
MKHLKPYNESKKEFGLLDIVYILQDYTDEGYVATIFSATGHAFYPSDTDDISISNFKLKRYANQKNESFRFRIDFNESKNYSELVSFLDEMNVAMRTKILMLSLSIFAKKKINKVIVDKKIQYMPDVDIIAIKRIGYNIK